jgi:hypothetical protein
VAPPARRTAEPHQAGGLGGDAVGRHQLLLLADRAHEAECVPAEAQQPDQRDGEQRHARAQSNPRALARTARSEHQEWQQQAGRDLDADAGRQRRRAGAPARTRPGCQRQRRRQRQEQQRVVVRPSDRQHEQHRVQAHERRGPASRVSEPARRPRDQRHRREARDDRDRLERPQPARKSQGDQRVAEQREQRAVGRVLERPADEVEDVVGGRFGGDVRVGVEAMQDPQPCERQIAEDVL